MALKALVKNLDNVDEKYHDLYKKGEDGFYLDLEGVDQHPAAGALKRAKDRVSTERDNLKEQLKEKDTSIQDLEKKIKEGGGDDIKALETSWQTKYDTDLAALQSTIEKKDKTLNSILVDKEASRLSAEWSTMPALMRPMIQSRLAPEVDDDGTARTRVLDKNGKPSAMSLDDLRKEFAEDPDFKGAMLSEKKGSGTGGSENKTGGHTGGSASERPEGNHSAGKKGLNDLTPEEWVAHRAEMRKAQETNEE